LDDNWEPVCHMESFKMDTEDSLNFHLLPKLDGLDGRAFSPLNYLQFFTYRNPRSAWILIKLFASWSKLSLMMIKLG
jgi:hypothetical protein